MTDEEALRIYDEFFGGSFGGEPSSSPLYDDDDRADMAREVSLMLAAETADEAMRVISWWGNTKRNSEICIAMRAKYDANGKRKVTP